MTLYIRRNGARKVGLQDIGILIPYGWIVNAGQPAPCIVFDKDLNRP